MPQKEVINLKIAYVLPINWGGIPHYTAELANAVAKYEDVIVIKPKGSNDNLFSEDINVINSFDPLTLIKGQEKKAFSLKNIKSLYSYKNVRILNDLKPDIIHFTGTYVHASFFSKLFRIEKKYPVVVTKHAVADRYLVSSKDKPFFSTLLWNLNDFSKHMINPDKFVVHTLENKQSMVDNGIEPKRIAVMPHGSYTFFKKYSIPSQENANDKVTEQKEDNSVLYFGYIGPHKGVEYLIEAAPIISKNIPDVKIVIAGEGNFSECAKHIEDGSFFEIYNEFIPDSKVHEFFERAKVVVFPYTYHQGLSGVLAISFAFGKPVIVTDVGNLSKFAESCGLVVPPNNSKAIAEAVIKIFKDDKLRMEMAKKSSQKGLDLSWDNIAKEHIKMYENILIQRT